MALPLKDLPLGIRQHTHKVLSRIAKSRGLSLSELGREIIEQHVAKAIHDSKVILGQDDDDLEQGELDLETSESHRITRSGRK